MIQIHGLCIDLDKRTVTIHEEPIELTFKEFELLKYLAKNEGRVSITRRVDQSDLGI